MPVMKEVLHANSRTRTCCLLGALIVFGTTGGCVGTRLHSIATENRVALSRLSIGMTAEEVERVMGDGSGVMNNPYRTASRVIEDGVVMTVMYYFTDWSRKSRFEIPDDALTPLVFRDRKLVGWGRRFFEKEVNRFELRKR